MFLHLYYYLNKFNFKYICSNKYEYDFPYVTTSGFSDFDALFVNTDYV